ncbi:MAG: hypothetical protein QOG99_3220 [Frankiales bacterium]|jgi:hypothetical protein|nr:hypothetical protein [Frankiales bacterium]
MTALLGCALLVAVVAAVRGTWSPCGLSMLSAINPLSEQSRGHRYGLTCTWFVAGSVLGGVAMGALGAVLSPLASLVPAAAVGCVAALVTLASDLRLGGFSLPTHPRQVDETWFGAFRRWVYAAGFGAQIGIGFATYIMTAATYLVVVLAALTGSAVAALAVGAVFGLLRGLAVLLSAAAQTPADLRRLHRRLDRLGPWSSRTAVAAQAFVAVVLADQSAGPAGTLIVVVALAAAAVTHAIFGTVGRLPTRLRTVPAESSASSHGR